MPDHDTRGREGHEPEPQSYVCHECGKSYSQDCHGVTTHDSDSFPDGIDHDADADHVPYGKDVLQ